MATFPSKQKKRQDLVDPMLVFVSIALLSILIAFGPLNGNYSSIPNVLVMEGGAADHASSSVGVSFASDLQYWDANCSRGWTSDSTCDVLVSRTQSCVIGTGSAYCSEYAAYLQQIRNQRNRIFYQDLYNEVKNLQVHYEPGDFFVMAGRTYGITLSL